MKEEAPGLAAGMSLMPTLSMFYGTVNSGYDTGYVKDVGLELWRSLSTALNEKVTKSNIHGVLKRYAEQKKDVVVSANPNISWGGAINVSQFYGRTAELETLSQWILGDRKRKQ